MPFDGTTTKGAKAVRMLDRMIEMFDGGDGWVCGVWKEYQGKVVIRRCLMEAMRVIRLDDPEGTRYANTGRYISKVIGRKYGCQRISSFNDWPDQTYERVHRVLLEARELASSDV